MAVRNVPSCTAAATQTVHDDVSTVDDDILQLPNCSPTNWGGTFTMTKRVTLQGGGVTTGVVNGITVPVTCDTNIIDNNFFDPVFNIQVPPCTYPCGGDGLAAAKLLNMCFTDGGIRSNGSVWAYLTRGGTTDNDGRQLRIGYLRIEGMNNHGGFTFYNSMHRGVMDHIYFNLNPTMNNFFTYHIAGGFDIGYGQDQDANWTAPINYGGNDWFFYEDINIDKEGTTPYAITDGASDAGKFVFRNSRILCGRIEVHGTETGWYRGHRGIEAYRNTFNACNPGTDGDIIYVRSGGLIAWSNTADNFAGGSPVAHLVNYRSLGPQGAYDVADGVNIVDINNGSNPIHNNRLVSSAGTLTVTDSTASFGTLTGYVVKKESCLTDIFNPCSALILSNTSTQITFRSGLGGAWPDLSFTGGDLFDVNRVTHALDQPCRGQGSFGTIRNPSSLTISGTTATMNFASCPGCYSTSDWVVILATFCERAGGAACNGTAGDRRPYQGVYQIFNATDTSFDYTPRQVPTANASGDVAFKKVTNIPMNQVTEECVEWLNTNNGSLNHIDPGQYVDLFRANEHYFNYTTGSFDSSFGVKSGTSLPGSCSEGNKFWKTNEGNWDSTLPANTSGVLYRCGSSNNWSIWYTPYQYPHHLVSGTTPQNPSTTLMGCCST